MAGVVLGPMMHDRFLEAQGTYNQSSSSSCIDDPATAGTTLRRELVSGADIQLQSCQRFGKKCLSRFSEGLPRQTWHVAQKVAAFDSEVFERCCLRFFDTCFSPQFKDQDHC